MIASTEVELDQHCFVVCHAAGQTYISEMQFDPTKDSSIFPTTNRSAVLRVLPSIMLPMFLAVVDQTIVATALPVIGASTGNVQRVSWIVVGYLIASTIAAPAYGRLGDAFGRRRLMFVALAVFIVASVFCAVSPTIEWLTAARVLQGLGGGRLMTLSQALIGETVPPRERGRYQGYLAAVAVCANTFGPVVGGYLTEHFGWQSIFLINVPIGIVALLLARSLPTKLSQGSNWRPDPIGLLLFTTLVATSLLALEQAQQYQASALPVIGALFAAAALTLLLLMMQESRVRSPFIPLTLLRQPVIWRSDALVACHGAALVSLITFLPVYLQVVRGHSPGETGLLLIPITIGIGTGSLITGRLVTRTRLTNVFPAIGLPLVTAAIVFLGFRIDEITTPALVALLIWIGLFMGTVMGVVQVVVQSASGLQRLGEAAASVQVSRSMGAAFGTAVVATILFAALSIKHPETARVFAAMMEHGPPLASSSSEQTKLHEEISQAFRIAFWSIAGYTALGSLLAFSIPLRRI
jgi:EmrB/QacA subfamily drug resistance transporter